MLNLYIIDISKIWSVKTTCSKNYKMIQVKSKMSVEELFSKISKIFQVNKNMIVLTYTFKPPNSSEPIQVEIAPSNENALYHTLETLWLS